MPKYASLRYIPANAALHHFIALRIMLLLRAKSQHVPTVMPVLWRLQHALARLTTSHRVVRKSRVHLIPSRLNAANLHRQFVCLSGEAAKRI